MHQQPTHQFAVSAHEIAPRKKAFNFPDPFTSIVQGRSIPPLARSRPNRQAPDLWPPHKPSHG